MVGYIYLNLGTFQNNRGWVTKDGGRDEETAGVSALIAD